MIYNNFGWAYPAGAENDPNAPWNEEDFDERAFTDDVFTVTSKRVTISSSQYQYDEDHDQYYCDNFLEEMKSQQMTPYEILQEIIELSKCDQMKQAPRDIQRTIRMLALQSEGWQEDEVNYV